MGGPSSYREGVSDTRDGHRGGGLRRHRDGPPRARSSGPRAGRITSSAEVGPSARGRVPVAAPARSSSSRSLTSVRCATTPRSPSSRSRTPPPWGSCPLCWRRRHGHRPLRGLPACRTRRSTRRGTGRRTRRPDCSRGGVRPAGVDSRAAAGARSSRAPAAIRRRRPRCRSGARGRVGRCPAAAWSIDAKSGVSGAGRTPSAETHYVAANESVTPYGVGTHRHTPEIAQSWPTSPERRCRSCFAPHLVPMTRGLLATVYLDVARRPHDGRCGRRSTRALRRRAVRARCIPMGACPRPPRSRGSNRAHIGVAVDATDERARRRVRDRQPGEGRRRAGRAVREHRARVRRDRRARRDPGRWSRGARATRSACRDVDSRSRPRRRRRDRARRLLRGRRRGRAQDRRPPRCRPRRGGRRRARGRRSSRRTRSPRRPWSCLARTSPAAPRGRPSSTPATRTRARARAGVADARGDGGRAGAAARLRGRTRSSSRRPASSACRCRSTQRARRHLRSRRALSIRTAGPSRAEAIMTTDTVREGVSPSRSSRRKDVPPSGAWPRARGMIQPEHGHDARRSSRRTRR